MGGRVDSQQQAVVCGGQWLFASWHWALDSGHVVARTTGRKYHRDTTCATVNRRISNAIAPDLGDGGRGVDWAY